jgi:hypothetical protein
MQLLRCAANARVYSAALENSKNEEIERLVVRWPERIRVGVMTGFGCDDESGSQGFGSDGR